MIKFHFPLQPLLCVFCAFALLLCACSKSNPKPCWLVYYGNTLNPADLAGVDLAILDPDQIDARVVANGRTRLVAYVSVGEAETYRGYWNKIAKAPFLLEPNANWAGNHLVDVRDPDWQRLLLDDVIPKALARGYDGVFLDTVDTASYLEHLDSVKYAGSCESLQNFVGNLRARYPKILILPNNGLEMLDALSSLVDGIVVEDLYTRYDFGTKIAGPTPAKDTEYKRAFLDTFVQKTRKPVYNILYADGSHAALGHWAIEASEKAGYGWYLTGVDLMKVGIMQR